MVSFLNIHYPQQIASKVIAIICMTIMEPKLTKIIVWEIFMIQTWK